MLLSISLQEVIWCEECLVSLRLKNRRWQMSENLSFRKISTRKNLERHSEPVSLNGSRRLPERLDPKRNQLKSARPIDRHLSFVLTDSSSFLSNILLYFMISPQISCYIFIPNILSHFVTLSQTSRTIYLQIVHPIS